MPNEKISAVLKRLKRDPDRTIRTLVQNIFDDEKERELKGERIQANEIHDGVLVASPYSKKVKKAWRESTADRFGPELVPYFGLFYLVSGLPIALVVLLLWADSFGLIDPTVAPDPSIRNLVRHIFHLPLHPLSLALFF